MMQKEHFLEQHDPERKDFQIDRLILFSDAVFAIAITLLIIEIKAPKIEPGDTDSHILDQLLILTPKFVGFIISFFVVAIYWRSHHRIFGFVTQYTEKLIWINILFLFSIVLMPFSSAYYSDNFRFGIPFFFYNGNVILTGFSNYWLLSHVFKTDNHLVKHPPTQQYLHTFKTRSIITPAIFLFGIFIGIYYPLPGRLCFILIWPVFAILNRYYRWKYPKTAPPKNHKHHQ